MKIGIQISPQIDSLRNFFNDNNLYPNNLIPANNKKIGKMYDEIPKLLYINRYENKAPNFFIVLDVSMSGFSIIEIQEFACITSKSFFQLIKNDVNDINKYIESNIKISPKIFWFFFFIKKLLICSIVLIRFLFFFIDLSKIQILYLFFFSFLDIY
mgnify:CR=1 FL=1